MIPLVMSHFSISLVCSLVMRSPCSSSLNSLMVTCPLSSIFCMRLLKMGGMSWSMVRLIGVYLLVILCSPIPNMIPMMMATMIRSGGTYWNMAKLTGMSMTLPMRNPSPKSPIMMTKNRKRTMAMTVGSAPSIPGCQCVMLVAGSV